MFHSCNITPQRYNSLSASQAVATTIRLEHCPANYWQYISTYAHGLWERKWWKFSQECFLGDKISKREEYAKFHPTQSPNTFLLLSCKYSSIPSPVTYKHNRPFHHQPLLFCTDTDASMSAFHKQIIHFKSHVTIHRWLVIILDIKISKATSLQAVETQATHSNLRQLKVSCFRWDEY